MQGDINVGTHVWVGDPELAWTDGIVFNIKGDEAEIQTPDGKMVVSNLSKLHPRDLEAPDWGVADLTKLAYLHEPAVLHNLATRYGLNEIYTYSGNILIAVNPFQGLSNVYDTSVMERYKGAALGELSPHVFAIADIAYRATINEGKSNSILVSGESGAGKTETTKMLMRYLAYLAGCAGTGAGGRTIEQQVLESNPVLEAFGNAKTVRNNNSSRFGKFVEIQFDNRGRISGAAIRTYLLERSRVCQISDPERNYHCFYLLCAAPQEEIERYKLGDPRSFHYLNQSSCYELVGVSDSHDYLATRKAMDIVGINREEQDAIFRMVAAILHLGNVDFAKGEEDSSVIKDESEFHFRMTAELLMCDHQALQNALCKRVMVTPEEIILKSLNPVAAAISRDGLAKTIYSCLFQWLVHKINVSIGQDCHSQSLIGVLDIYGFESFKTNSFEQFCINFTNEKLQQHFNQHVFKLEQEEYRNEEIDWRYVDFVDNQDVLDLIEKKPGGIISLLDEACMFPKSSHETFAQKLYQTFKDHRRFIKPKLTRADFTIVHYAGEVQYKSDQFLDKNKDYIVPEHQDLLSASRCSFVAQLFPALSEETAKSSKFSSIGSRFKLQLQQLMDTLNSTEPHYIRCVKPNSELKPAIFENVNVLRQLRSGGVLEAIRVKCAGFPTRRTFSEFLRRFAILAPEILQGDYEENVACRWILEKVGLTGYQIGKTKIFLQGGQMAELDSRRVKVLGQSATVIQKQIRRHITRKHYTIMRRACIRIQANWRGKLCLGRLARELYQNIRRDAAAIKIQKNLHRQLARKRYNIVRSAAIVLQSGIRSMVARNELEFRMQTRAATIIQANWRGKLCLGKLARELFQKIKRDAAATKIQKSLRRQLARKQYNIVRSAAIVLQAGIRSMVARNELVFRVRTRAATIIQAYWRGKLCLGMLVRELYQNIKRDAAAIKIQKNLWRQLARKQYTIVRSAAIVLQTGIRSMVACNELVFRVQARAATIIQAYWRGKLCLGKLVRELYQNIKRDAAAIKIQKNLRRQLARKRYHIVRSTAIVLQTGIRSMVARNELVFRVGTRAATLVQAYWRGYTAVLEYKKLKEILVIEDVRQTNELEAVEFTGLASEKELVSVTAEEHNGVFPFIQETSSPPTIQTLGAQVQKLKALLLAEKQRADESERKLAETKELSEKRGKKLEETEKRVYKLQDSLNRLLHSMSDQFSQLKTILHSPPHSTSTSQPVVRDNSSSSDSSSSSSSNSSSLSPTTALTIANASTVDPTAIEKEVQDLSATESTGSEKLESDKEGAFDDYF